MKRIVAGLLALSSVLILSVGCAGSRPGVKVIGVTEDSSTGARRLLRVFVEVQNPTSRDIELSALDYNFRAESWFDSIGRVALTRSVGAQSSAVVEITVPVTVETQARSAGDVSYELDGTLFGNSGHIEKKWRVRASGNLSAAHAVSRGSHTASIVLD